MKKYLLLLVALVLLGASQPVLAGEVTAVDKPRVVMKLDHFTDDLHAVLMALKIGTGLENKGQDVVLFLNLEAARLADKNHPLNLRWGDADATVETIYKGFLSAGGEVLVCPHCASVAGVTADDMREGAKIATADEVMTLFAEADKVISY